MFLLKKVKAQGNDIFKVVEGAEGKPKPQILCTEKFLINLKTEKFAYKSGLREFIIIRPVLQTIAK